MNELPVVVAFDKAGRQWRAWAESERDIDFRGDSLSAGRCTACFGAAELKTFLEKTCPGLKVIIAESAPPEGYFIELAMEEKDTGGGFSLIPLSRGMVIKGHGRNGLLNGVYELLRMQGWMWTEPGEAGEKRPVCHKLVLPRARIDGTPSFRYRCLDAFRESHDSIEYLLWMARNRLNVCFRKSASGKFADKLGMRSRAGGHLLSKIANPARVLKNGRTLWEEHPEWYGKPPGGKRRRETAARVQLCASQPALLDYVGDEVVRLLAGPLGDVDMLDLWGFDTHGDICACAGCRGKGNGSDRNLLLLSAVRSRLDRAFADGEINRRVLLDTAAYEGTVTLEGPENPVPENLVEAGDICIFYPLKRCYRHGLHDVGCSLNARYADSLSGWAEGGGGLSLWAGEYYNLSKFEDLPVLFSKTIPGDMRFYHSSGFQGATYMHAPCVNWAMRSLTQMQHAQYAWDVNTDDEKFLESYFSGRYGIHAEAMRGVYGLIEDAMAGIASWRNWGRDNLLGKLSAWDGSPPGEELIFGHFKNSGDASRSARSSIAMLEKAAGLLDALLIQEQARNWEGAIPAERDAVNPEELEASRKFDALERRIGESRRLLVYGIDTMRIMSGLLEYHQALLKKDWARAGKRWEGVEQTARRMEGYFVPIKFENPGAGLISPDALTRTQLRRVVARCRGARIKGLMPSC